MAYKTWKLLALMGALCLMMSTTVQAQTTGSIQRKTSVKTYQKQKTSTQPTYTADEMAANGHQFFGGASRDIGRAITHIFSRQGEPTAYIVGEEGAGAFVGGLRYGEGTIYYKTGIKQKIYWQGPSVGFDFGGNGSRTMVLVYNSRSPRDLYTRYGGVEGSAYIVGGVGVNYQQHGNIILAPIRTGLGARLGANLGYLKYSSRPTWNPF